MQLGYKVMALASVALVAMPSAASARSQIRAVGSSTVYPFATAVAERLARANPNMQPPVIESTGTGGGFKLFCAGVGEQHPDISDASRRIKASEVKTCVANGVNQITEIQVGIDGIAFATATGTAPGIDNVRSRVVNAAVKRAKRAADEVAAKGGDPVRLPAGITPHSLRRTFASVLYALGENPAVVMAEMGHTDPALALRIYAQAMRRDEDEAVRLRAMIDVDTTADGQDEAQRTVMAGPDVARAAVGSGQHT